MKILVADGNLVPHRDRFEALAPPGSDIRWLTDGVPDAELREAQVYVGSRFTADMAHTAAKLQLIHVAGAGTDRIELSALRPDTIVANTFHHENSIAEYVVSAAAMLRRGFLAQDRALRRGIWATSVYDPAIAQPTALGDARIGFVGFGHIGACSWSLLRAFGCTAAAVTGSGRVAPDSGLLWAGDTGQLDRLMQESDVVVVSAPLTPQTTGMIGTEQLAALGPDGILINVGRGPLVQEQALYDALFGRVIAGAAIDVWYRYPNGDTSCAPSELPFDRLDNLLMTPHSSGVTSATFAGRAGDVAANIVRLQRGDPLRNVVHGPAR
ncbi:hydroxyacid dehydrogenase [Mycolicibacterium sp. 018/SC-01/001]|uniref:2-hydroxyacid dehydrogenase n=1 Tax=Mycolicibacterium sp. 018/SC-01/001 TaxID=2592069 RepID=UPI00117FD1A6|nr:2-hydroxyacid dehydrogenase [Mycolicibacterium sp. 018/SC-01/001]TRW86292.1 hydroxyacid dehydrogenase [Mycolicibacterium sp. 018/SC-01/001]